MNNDDLDRVLFWKTCNGHVGTLTDIVPSAHSYLTVSFSEGGSVIETNPLEW